MLNIYFAVVHGQFRFVGKERMHDEEASKWQAVFWYHYQDVGYEVFTIWVTERQGVFVPLRSSSVSVYEKIRTFSYIDYFDYDVSDIDPEIWNIKKGMDCKYSVSSDVKNDSDFEKMIDITNVPERFNHFGYFAGNLRNPHWKITSAGANCHLVCGKFKGLTLLSKDDTIVKEDNISRGLIVCAPVRTHAPHAHTDNLRRIKFSLVKAALPSVPFVSILARSSCARFAR
ncbi:hypothetical protein MSG28_013940 [Choristoneura fumiferana]|uniref:Uncharacterized protein n=1 Tax=Choristoneura fumiferana TaxID=7141 RepID=A0ACC0KA24_CHOFU|nr:hypothetical protein MSG28_013940 [Choristoneura fumiferana]